MAQHRVDIGGDVILKVFQMNPRQLAPGSDIRLAIDPEDVVLLRD